MQPCIVINKKSRTALAVLNQISCLYDIWFNKLGYKILNTNDVFDNINWIKKETLFTY